MTILLVCADEDRLNRLKAAIQSAGFRTISARSLDDAWAKSYSYDFNAVVIDECTAGLLLNHGLSGSLPIRERNFRIADDPRIQLIQHSECYREVAN